MVFLKEKNSRAYNGNAPYGFISYAHRNDAKVLPVVNELYRQKYRVWYDEGIEVGVNWPQKVATRLKNSELVLIFLSGRFLESQNCMRELNYAVAEKREMFCIFLEKVTLPEDTAMQLATVGKLDAGNLSAQEIVSVLQKKNIVTERFLGDGIEGYTRENSGTNKSFNFWQAASILFAFLFLGALLFGFGYIKGWFGTGVQSGTEVVTHTDGSKEELTLTTWSDGLTRDILLRSANESVLYLCGNSILNLATEIHYADGWYAGSTVVENGGLQELSALQGKPLTHLAVVYQQLTDMDGITEFENLVYLDISGNAIMDLTPLKGLSRLEVLKIRHIPASDLSVLLELPALRYVYVSEEMCPYISGILDAAFDVIVKK